MARNVGSGGVEEGVQKVCDGPGKGRRVAAICRRNETTNVNKLDTTPLPLFRLTAARALRLLLGLKVR